MTQRSTMLLKGGVALSTVAFGALWFVGTPFVFAHEENEVSQTRTDRVEAMKQESQDAHQDIQTMRKDFRTEMLQKRTALRDEVKNDRTELRDMVKNLSPQEAREKREDFRKDVMQKRETLREDFKTHHEEFKQKAQERKDELKKKIGEERAKHVDEFFTRMMDRMAAAIARLDSLANRIESRLDKISESGKNTTDLEAKLEKARTSITAAQKALEDAKTKFVDLAKSDNPKEAFPQVRDLVAQVRDAVKAAHTALVDVINSIKQGRLDETATTTPQQ